MTVTASDLPPSALLAAYGSPSSPGRAGTYVDCFSVAVGKAVCIDGFVAAFYTTPLFRIERFVLRYLFGLPSSDDDAAAVARGDADRFAAWTVEARSGNQLLMCDLRGRTRSWFMVDAAGDSSRLYFGSAVLPKSAAKPRRRGIGFTFRALLGFHRLYSVLLLAAAHRKLSR